MGIVTVDKLENADKDADALDTFINGADTATVTTRKSKKYPTLANAVKQVIETGGFEPFATESALLASRPTITKKAAKALDTKKVWLWNGSEWNDTGLSELELAKKYTSIKNKDSVKRIKVSVKEKLVSISDAFGNPTWLEANAEDGGLTNLAKYHLLKVFNSQFNVVSNDDFFSAQTDRNGIATDNTLDKTGQFAEFVVERLSPRLIKYVTPLLPFPKLFTTQEKNSINNDFYYAETDRNGLATDHTLDNSGQIAEFVLERLAPRLVKYLEPLLPIPTIEEKPIPTLLYPVRNKISIWGSSSVEGMHSAFSTMASELGFTDVYLGGKGSERMQQTCARFGSHPVQITVAGGIIPESGSITVSAEWDGTSAGGLKAYTGTFNGVHGTLSYLSNTTCTFARTNDGSAVEAAGSFPFIPDKNTYRDGVVIFNLAKNNLTSTGTSGDPKKAFEWTKDAYEYAKAYFKFVLVVGHFVNTNTLEQSKNQTLTYNQLCEEYFEDRYVDIQNYLTSEQVWIDANITPTTDDLAQQSRGEKPTSLSKDDLHLNSLGSQLVVNQIKNKLLQLNWSNLNA